jgi:hypothetical protein
MTRMLSNGDSIQATDAVAYERDALERLHTGAKPTDSSVTQRLSLLPHKAKSPEMPNFISESVTANINAVQRAEEGGHVTTVCGAYKCDAFVALADARCEVSVEVA